MSIYLLHQTYHGNGCLCCLSPHKLDLSVENSVAEEQEPAVYTAFRWRNELRVPQNTVHFLPRFFTGGGHKTARMASSNTVFKPRWVRAEHSRYFTAPIKPKISMSQWYMIQCPMRMPKHTYSMLKKSFVKNIFFKGTICKIFW